MPNRSLKAATISVSLDATVQNEMSLGDGDTVNTASGVVSLTRSASVLTGIDAEQADRAWQWSDTIPAGNSRVFWLGRLTGHDIGAGDGRDIVGQVWDAVEIVAILIVNNNEIGNYGYLEISPGYTIPAQWIGTHTVATGGGVGAQGFLYRYEPDVGLPVTPGVAESIRVFANGGDVNCSIAILGRSSVNESSSSSSSLSSVTSSSSSSSVTSSTSSSSGSSSSGHSSSSSSSGHSSSSSLSSSSSSKSSVTSSSSSSSSGSSSSS